MQKKMLAQVQNNESPDRNTDINYYSLPIFPGLSDHIADPLQLALSMRRKLRSTFSRSES